MKSTHKRHYSEAFKKEAVMRVKGQNSSANKVSKDPGVSQSVLSRWAGQFKKEGTSVFGQESKKLQTENKRLKAERDILKKAVSFFTKSYLLSTFQG